ncbi:hypothetical protein GCM10011344_15510 [Dokdonia pacifica]|uniref:Gliding motility-associated C-terminal domain-containing protein n=1 Tax=Dokdonia pacifica TaxID=1627892 RepID=A0A238W1N1_9FLAO|nr:choice-of-anchor L domain-containing protein [Dokdonia pacifica]GGG15821.1 hypothetical protein GCM10011344_15510 [Dokdonia pacifica]SNR40264.1 gliding motility-associated C-terminal domain-containing protein [Dokdonia pacifica]
MRKQLFSFLFASLFSVLGYGQITIDESITAQELVEDVLINSSCAEVSNIESSTGVDFGDVNGISFFSANGSDFPFEEGILLMSGDVQQAPGPNLTTQSNGGWPGDADLEANTTAINTNNASFIEFNFTPFIEQISFDFIMASEEYDQNFECTFSDAFAFILTDVTTGDVQNLAVIPGTTIPIEVTNIRPEVPGQCAAVNEEFFDRYNFLPFNDENAAATNFNGQTVPLTAMADVTPGNPYTIKLVVADQGDSAFDIGVFLEAGSFNIGATDLGDDILVANGNAACEGDTITLNAEDPDAVSYMWFMDGVEIVGETNPTLDVTLPGVYSVVVALSNTDCVIEDEVVVEFITSDDVELGDDIVGCEGDTVTLDTGFADGIASYAWFFNSAILIDELNPTLDVTEAGEYAVTVTFNSGCSFSDTINVSFETAPIIELGDTINSCLENPTTLDATPSNIDPADATYSWTLDGVVIAGETNPTLDITQEGVYEVTVTSGPCVVTDFVTVNALTLLFELGDDFNTCFEETVTLDATPTNVDPAEATYEWSLDGTVIAGETSPMLTITEEGTYDVTVTFGICSDTDTITVTLANPDGSPCTEPEPSDCTTIDAGPDLEVDCDNPCVDLDASIITLPLTDTSSYRIEQIECPNPPTSGDPTNLTMDDTWSGVIDIPFTFNYYQNDYTSLVIGANGQISFDTSLAGGFNDWNIDPGQTIPNNDQATFPFNTIYGAFHDIDPGVNNDPDAINFFVSGDAPYRTFVLNFDMVAQFSCNDLLTSQQIVLYESLNVIEVNIINKPVCATWNDGLATLGIIGNDNTEFAVPPGRNTDDWEGIDESWRFIPDGEVSDDAEFAWLDEDGNVISNDLIFNVCPTETTTYTATLTITNPDGSTTTISDDVTVTANVVDYNVDLGGDEVFCDVNSFEIVPTLTGDVNNPTFLWSTGETTETITVTTTDIYTVEVMVDGCVMMDEVTITFLTSPCTIEADCLVIDFLEDFGTGTERVSTPFTEYTFNPGPGQVNDGEYAIINTSADLNTGWHDNLEDNTPGDINGRALFVNADFNTDEFYRRTVDGLLTDTDYTFSSFITTVYDTDTGICPNDGIPANVTFRVEDSAGATLAEIETGDIPNEADPNWQQFIIGFNSGANTSVQIVLVNNSIGGCGNDLAIDDISLSFSGEEPEIETPADINVCDITVGAIDLTSQISTILNGLDPTDFQITFHTTQLDSEGGVNEIANPSAYTNTTTPETIYVRVERLTDDSCFSVVDFDLISIPPTLDLGGDQIICNDGSFTIVPTLTGNIADITYDWSTGETTDSITVSSSGTVSLTITTIGGCSVTDDIVITVESPIGISLGEDFTTCREFPNTLTAVSEDPNVTYEWFLNGDLITGETSSTLDFVVPETAVGTQEYSVVITSALGCTSSDTVEVSLFDVGNCVISEGISPDDTPGFNDTLDLEFLAARSGIDVLQIYNRLGTLVYEQTDYVNQWRGQTDNGNDLPTGTYFYVLNLETEDSVYGRQATGWIYINRGE